jgi:hypothetical protein
LAAVNFKRFQLVSKKCKHNSLIVLQTVAYTYTYTWVCSCYGHQVTLLCFIYRLYLCSCRMSKDWSVGMHMHRYVSSVALAAIVLARLVCILLLQRLHRYVYSQSQVIKWRKKGLRETLPTCKFFKVRFSLQCDILNVYIHRTVKYFATLWLDT